MNSFYFWLWFFICFASVILEIITLTTLVSIWFALGAILALITYFLGFDFSVQILVFFISSIASVLVIRPLTAKHIRGNIVPTNADRLISMRTTLLKGITEQHVGEISIHGLIWNAVTVDGSFIEKGALIEIVALEGSKVLVKKI